MPGNAISGGVDLLTLQAVLEFCRNWFFKPERIIKNTFTISGGQLVGISDRLKTGQYYRIVGSDFNDGLHQWGRESDTLTDEMFYGSVWPLSIPPAVTSLAQEISTWEARYGDAASSPLSSESFGGYSYTKASVITADGGGGWQAAFCGQLSRWRKL